MKANQTKLESTVGSSNKQSSIGYSDTVVFGACRQCCMVLSTCPVQHDKWPQQEYKFRNQIVTELGWDTQSQNIESAATDKTKVLAFFLAEIIDFK